MTTDFLIGVLTGAVTFLTALAIAGPGAAAIRWRLDLRRRGPDKPA